MRNGIWWVLLALVVISILLQDHRSAPDPSGDWGVHCASQYEC